MERLGIRADTRSRLGVRDQRPRSGRTRARQQIFENIIEHFTDPVTEFKTMRALLKTGARLAHSSPRYEERYLNTRYSHHLLSLVKASTPSHRHQDFERLFANRTANASTPFSKRSRATKAVSACQDGDAR
ncbi:MAG: hypothetical protein LCH57_00350 [Proteobacteria bacterium]|nr:hypothetical protein [Pseudomonadota bacterium]